MKYFFRIALIILFAVSLYGCGKTEQKDISDLESKVEFGLVGQKSFQINNTSDWLMVIPQIFLDSGTQYLSRLDIPNNQIEIYDYDKGNLVNEISFDKEGPNSIKGSIVGFQVINKDSIFIIDNSSYLVIANFKSEIIGKYNARKDFTDSPNLKASVIPASINSDVISLINYPIVNPKRMITIDLNLKDSTISKRNVIPDEYINGFWSVGDFSWYSFVKVGDTRIFNFPNLDSLYIYEDGDDNSKPFKVYAGSKAIQHPIKDIVSPEDYIPSEEELERLPFTRPIYARLLYDEYRQVYYRIIGKPIAEYLLDSNDPIKSRTREYYILVLDHEFNWLGEFDLPSYENMIDIDLTFISKEGINLQRESTDEDYAVFDVYSIIENDKK